MNIAFLINDLNNKGGTERVTTVVANGLAKRNSIDKVHILSIQNGLNPVYPVEDDVELSSLNLEGIGVIQRRILAPIRVKKFLKQKNIKILICTDIGPYVYLRNIVYKLCKIVVWEHFNYFNMPRGWRDKIEKKVAARNADAMVVLGSQDLNNYKNNVSGIKNIRVINNPLAVKTERSATLKNKRVLAAGRLVHQKGFDMLLDVWAKVQRLGDFKDWKLDIFGDGPDKDALELQIDNEDIINVYIHPFTSSLESEYMKSSLFVLSSRYEGFGLVLCEAQAYGLPTVSFDIHEGPKEIIENNINGYLVTPFDLNEMAVKLSKLMSDPSILESFSRHAKDDLQRFSLNKVLDKWENLFEELNNEN